MAKKTGGRRERRMCCECHSRPKASNRSYCKRCWAARAAAKRTAARLEREVLAGGHVKG